MSLDAVVKTEDEAGLFSLRLNLKYYSEAVNECKLIVNILTVLNLSTFYTSISEINRCFFMKIYSQSGTYRL